MDPFLSKNFFRNRSGQSLMELLVGMAVGAILIVGSTSIIAASLQSNGKAASIQIETELGQELLNNTKSFAAGNWNSLLSLATGSSNTYFLYTSSSPFTIYNAALNNYFYSRSITVNGSQVSSTQSNFPVLISGTYSYLAASSSGGYVQNVNGNDIIFTSDASGTAKLNWDIESYTPSTGNIVAWVNVPILNSSTVIYMFYDNAFVNIFQGNVSGAWNNNYIGVYHLNEATGTAAYDSTQYAHVGTWSGSLVNGSYYASGFIAPYAANFNGINDYISLGSSSVAQQGGTALTVSAWVESTSTGNTLPLTLWGDASDNQQAFQIYTTQSTIAFVVNANNGSDIVFSASAATHNGNWHLITGVFSNLQTEATYIDGVLVGSTTPANGGYSGSSSELCLSVQIWVTRMSPLITLGSKKRTNFILPMLRNHHPGF